VARARRAELLNGFTENNDTLITAQGVGVCDKRENAVQSHTKADFCTRIAPFKRSSKHIESPLQARTSSIPLPMFGAAAFPSLSRFQNPKSNPRPKHFSLSAIGKAHDNATRLSREKRETGKGFKKAGIGCNGRTIQGS